MTKPADAMRGFYLIPMAAVRRWEENPRRYVAENEPQVVLAKPIELAKRRSA